MNKIEQELRAYIQKNSSIQDQAVIEEILQNSLDRYDDLCKTHSKKEAYSITLSKIGVNKQVINKSNTFINIFVLASSYMLLLLRFFNFSTREMSISVLTVIGSILSYILIILIISLIPRLTRSKLRLSDTFIFLSLSNLILNVVIIYVEPWYVVSLFLPMVLLVILVTYLVVIKVLRNIIINDLVSKYNDITISFIAPYYIIISAVIIWNFMNPTEYSTLKVILLYGSYFIGSSYILLRYINIKHSLIILPIMTGLIIGRSSLGITDNIYINIIYIFVFTFILVLILKYLVKPKRKASIYYLLKDFTILIYMRSYIFSLVIHVSSYINSGRTPSNSYAAGLIHLNTVFIYVAIIELLTYLVYNYFINSNTAFSKKVKSILIK